MSATCHAKCPLICLYPLPPSPSPSLSLPREICTLFAQHATQLSCLPAPSSRYAFNFSSLCGAPGMPAGQRHKRLPLLLFTDTTSPLLLFISGWRLSFDLSLAPQLTLFALSAFCSSVYKWFAVLPCIVSFLSFRFSFLVAFKVFGGWVVGGCRKTQMTRVSCASGCFAAC